MVVRGPNYVAKFPDSRGDADALRRARNVFRFRGRISFLLMCLGFIISILGTAGIIAVVNALVKFSVARSIF